MGDDWTPADTAHYDQVQARAHEGIEYLAQALKERIGQVGEQQAVGDVTRAIETACSPPVITGMLVLALLRIIREELPEDA